MFSHSINVDGLSYSNRELNKKGAENWVDDGSKTSNGLWTKIKFQICICSSGLFCGTMVLSSVRKSLINSIVGATPALVTAVLGPHAYIIAVTIRTPIIVMRCQNWIAWDCMVPTYFRITCSFVINNRNWF